MELLIRKMGQSRWAGVGAAQYLHEMVQYEGSPAAAGLLVLTADTPVYAGHGAGRIKIVDEGFLWLQLAPENGYFWLTAMYDEKARLVQFYFDLTLGNHIRADGESWFADAFADVVITPGQAPRLLDVDELAQAQREGLLCAQQAQAVLCHARRIACRYADCSALAAYCRKLLARLHARSAGGAGAGRLRQGSRS